MKRTLLILLMLAAIGAQAQSIGPKTLNATGGTVTISGNTYEWSVGEMTVINTASSSTLVVTQGVLQPTTPTTGIKKTESFTAQQLKVYPTPTQNTLFIQPDFNKSGQLQCYVTDAAGKEILKHEANLQTGNEKQQINMESLAAGNYMLVVLFSSNTDRFQTAFKVQKLQ